MGRGGVRSAGGGKAEGEGRGGEGIGRLTGGER